MINRKKRESLQGDILRVLKGFDRPVSTQEIASKLGKPWHSVQTRCLMLQVEGRVDGFRVGRMNLWQLADNKEKEKEKRKK